jgi:hypothetical protein
MCVCVCVCVCVWMFAVVIQRAFASVAVMYRLCVQGPRGHGTRVRWPSYGTTTVPGPTYLDTYTSYEGALLEGLGT